MKLSHMVLLILLVLGALPAASAQPTASTYRVSGTRSATQRGDVAALVLDVLGGSPAALDVLATAGQVAQLRGWGLLVEPLAPPAARQEFPPQDTGYHTYTELVGEISAIQAAHPQIVKLFSIGRSVEGRELWAAKVSDQVAQDEDEPEALFIGLYHAREHLTAEMLLYLLRMLTSEYNPDEPANRVTQLVNSRQIYLVFMLNPDGGEYDISNQAYSYWRKNRQLNSCEQGGGTGRGIGTDPNRNHSYRWGGPGADTDPCGATYRGSGPASAPEVAALERFVNSRVQGGVQRISVAISFHTFGELVLWPYGYQEGDNCGQPASDMFPRDREVFRRIGQAMAGTNGYIATQACQLYSTSGDFADWAYGQHRIFGYTFEMYPCTRDDCPAYDFYPPDEVIASETARNREAVLLLLDMADCPFAVVGSAAIDCTNGRVNPRRQVWLPVVGN